MTSLLRVTDIQHSDLAATITNLSLDNQGNVTIGAGLKLQGVTSGLLTLSAPATTTATQFVFPANDGSAGQVLSTNGAGVTSWVNGGGGSAIIGETTTSKTYIGYGASAGPNSEQGCAFGVNALASLNSGGQFQAGENCTAFGNYALQSNTTGNNNTAMGKTALQNCVTGNNNTAVGNAALQNFISGEQNVAVGAYALFNLTVAEYNIGIGSLAGVGLTTGTQNIAIGRAALGSHNDSYNIAIGLGTMQYSTSGQNNVFVGVNAQPSSTIPTNQIGIGTNVVGTADNTITIGVGGTNQVYCDFSASATWVKSSDARLKTDVHDAQIGLSFINKLQPKTYRWLPSQEIPDNIIGYDKDKNHQNTDVVMHGLLAQEVKAALDELGISNFSGWSEREADGLQGISLVMFVLPLINAVNDLTKQVNALRQNAGI